MISKKSFVLKRNFALPEVLKVFWEKPQNIHSKFCAPIWKEDQEADENLKRKNWKKKKSAKLVRILELSSFTDPK